MKKVLLFSLAIVIGTLTMSAQKGMWVGGTAGLWHDSNSNSTGYSIMPEFGFKLNQAWDLGVDLGYSKDFNKSGVGVGGDFTGNKILSVSPFLRYNFLTGKLGGLFLDGGVSYANVKIDGIDDSENYFNIGIRPGVKVAVNKNFCLIGKFGFLGYEKYGDSDGSYGLNLDMNNVQIGVVYTF